MNAHDGGRCVDAIARAEVVMRSRAKPKVRRRAASAAVVSVLVLGAGVAGSQDEGAQRQDETDRLMRASLADQPRLISQVFDPRAGQADVIAEQRTRTEALARAGRSLEAEGDEALEPSERAATALKDTPGNPQVETAQTASSVPIPPPPKPMLLVTRREVPEPVQEQAARKPSLPRERLGLQPPEASLLEMAAVDLKDLRGGATPSKRSGPQLAQLLEPRPPEPLAPQPIPPAPTPAQPSAPEPASTPPSETVVPEPDAVVPAEKAEEDLLATAPDEPEPERIQPGEQLLIEARGLLLPAGTLQVEPNIDYTFSSSDRVAISGFTVFEAVVIGQIQVDDLERNVIQAAADLRYGITDRIQAAVRIPLAYRDEEQTIAIGTINQEMISFDGMGLGDVEASLSWQPPLPRGWWPDVILTADAIFPTGEDSFEIETRRIELESGGTRRVLTDAPTGAGFYGAGLSSTLVWRTDPVVYFAGGGYTFNLEDDKDGEFGEVDPGDKIELFAGLNIGLNEQVALNMSFTTQFIDETEQNGEIQEGTDITDARALFGSSIALAPNISLLGSVALGLTDESPDFQLTLRLPINFDLF